MRAHDRKRGLRVDRRWSCSCLPFAILLSSCFGEDARVGSSRLSTVERPPQRLLGDSTAFALPTSMALVGPYLVVLDGMASSAIQVVDTRTGAIVNRIAPRGDGPYEVRMPWTMFAEPTDPPRVWTFDLQTRRFTLWNVLAPPSEAVVQQFQFHGSVAPMSRPLLTTAGTLTTDLSSGNALVLFDSSGVMPYHHVGYPPFSPDDYPAGSNAHLTANDFFVAAEAKRRRIALLYRYAGRVDVYDVDANAVVASAATDSFPPPRLEKGVDWAVRYDVHTNGQSATSRYVYSMFCGCSMQDRARGRRARTVRIFDWRGRHVGDVGLDRYVSAIAVSANDSILYGAVQDPFPLIGEWELPPQQAWQ